MGWLFGWDTRKELIDHLAKDNMVLAHCMTGNNMWAVVEGTKQDGTTVRFIALFLIRGRNGSRDGWGYKDLDESCGPTAVNCPLKYLEMVKDYEPVGYAKEWRERVREYWVKRTRKLEVNQRIRLRGMEYVVRQSLGRSGYIIDCVDYPQTWRLPVRNMVEVEVLP